MKNQVLFNRINVKKALPRLLTIIYLLSATSSLFAQTPALGTTKLLGTVDSLGIQAKVQSPSAQETELQIICLFEYTEGDITSPSALPANLNGMLHVDNAFHGLITDLRKSGKFKGRAYETMLLTPAPGTIPAKKLLLIGLGDRNKFNAQIMVDIGRIGMREALRLGVTNYSHASDLKDAGIDSPTGPVAINVVKGAIDAYETELYLNKKGMEPQPSVKSVTLLAGPAFFTVSGDAIATYLKSRK